MLLLVLAAGCSAGNDSASEAPREVRVERISSSAPGQGPGQPRVVVAPSAAALSEAIDANIPDSGNGTYLAAYWGRKPTGGHSLAVESARLAGDRVTVELALRKPPPDAIVTQALTYPYAVAAIRDLEPGGKGFSFVDEEGRKLDWPVRRAGG